MRPTERNYQYEQQLSNAIKQHRRVRMRYKYDVHYRVLEPYILYKDEEKRIIIVGIRIKDEAKPNKQPAPCKYEVGLITDIVELNETFDLDRRFSSYRLKYKELEVLSAIDR
jgi:hypothetical protein